MTISGVTEDSFLAIVRCMFPVLTSAVSLGGGGGAGAGAGRGEAGARLVGCATRAVAFLTAHAEPEPALAALRDRLLHSLPHGTASYSSWFIHLLAYLITIVVSNVSVVTVAAAGVGGGAGAGGGGHARWWWGGGEWVAPLQELVWWALAQPARAGGAAALQALSRAPQHALQPIAPDPTHMRKVRHRRSTVASIAE